MCILCGELITQDHWTDVDISNNQKSTVVVGENQRNRRRNRLRRVHISNNVLTHYGLHLNEWNSSKFILKNKKGKTKIVHDLGALWPEVEQFINGPIDPLDPDLLEKIRMANEKKEIQ